MVNFYVLFGFPDKYNIHINENESQYKMKLNILFFTCLFFLLSCNSISYIDEKKLNDTQKTNYDNVSTISSKNLSEGIIINANTASTYFSETPNESKNDHDENRTYFMYGDIIWSSTSDEFAEEILPGEGNCLLAPGLESVLQNNLLPDDQLVGVLVFEWTSYYSLSLDQNDILSIFTDFGFNVNYTNDEVVNLRKERYINSKSEPEKHFIAVGSIHQIKNFIEITEATGEAYIFHLSPCFEGFYNDNVTQHNLQEDIHEIIGKGQIYIDNSLAGLFADSVNRHKVRYCVAVKCVTHDNKSNFDVKDIVAYLETSGLQVQYYYNHLNLRGTREQINYLNNSGVDLVFCGTYDIISTFVLNNLNTNYSFIWYLAPTIF